MTAPDLPPDLDAIQARADAATEGPYVLARYDHGGGRMFAQTASGERGLLVADTFKVGDREFHAEARTDVLALLALVREQQARIGRVEALASAWEARGESDMAFSKTLADENISIDLLGHGAQMVENARHIRTALTATEGAQ